MEFRKWDRGKGIDLARLPVLLNDPQGIHMETEELQQVLLRIEVAKEATKDCSALVGEDLDRTKLLAKTMEIAGMIAGNHGDSVKGIKKLLLEDMGGSLKNHWDNEKQFTRHVLRGAKAEDAFPEFIARKGRLSE